MMSYKYFMSHLEEISKKETRGMSKVSDIEHIRENMISYLAKTIIQIGTRKIGDVLVSIPFSYISSYYNLWRKIHGLEEDDIGSYHEILRYSDKELEEWIMKYFSGILFSKR